MSCNLVPTGTVGCTGVGESVSAVQPWGALGTAQPRTAPARPLSHVPYFIVFPTGVRCYTVSLLSRRRYTNPPAPVTQPPTRTYIQGSRDPSKFPPLEYERFLVGKKKRKTTCSLPARHLIHRCSQPPAPIVFFSRQRYMVCERKNILPRQKRPQYRNIKYTRRFLLRC